MVSIFLDISLLLSSPKSTSSCNYSTRHDTSGSGAITASSGADTITHILIVIENENELAMNYNYEGNSIFATNHTGVTAKYVSTLVATSS